MRSTELVLTIALLTGCATHREPVSFEVRTTLTDPALAKAQRLVWESWFAGDTAQLRSLTPGLVTIDGQAFVDQEQTIRSSAQFAASGSKLVSLAFPEMRVQRFGDVAVVYSLVEFVTANATGQTTHRSRATEVFVLDHGRWVNPGWHLENVH